MPVEINVKMSSLTCTISSTMQTLAARLDREHQPGAGPPQMDENSLLYVTSTLRETILKLTCICRSLKQTELHLRKSRTRAS